MSSLPKLSEADIRTWVGNTALSRGRPYTRDGSLLALRRQGNTIKAQCAGSAAIPYRVEAVLNAKGIASSDCSCPVGSGQCKHVAALLLSWVNTPDAFPVMEELATVLNQRSKTELVSLVTQMIKRYPDLERLLELSVVVSNTSAPVDPKVIARQVEQVFKQLDYGYDNYDGYGADNATVQELLTIKAVGDQYAASQEWSNAVTVYKTVMTGVLDNYELLDDEDGEFQEVVNECVTHLEPCLAAADEPLRQTILRSLFDLHRWDINWGGIDMGHEAPDLMIAYATPAERQQIADWVRTELHNLNDEQHCWNRETWGGFLLAIAGEDVDDETFLRICRESGRYRDLVERLLILGRTDDAIASTHAANTYDLLNMEAIFATHNLSARFADLIMARAKKVDDRRLKGWLKQYAIAQNDPALALRLVEEMFWSQPNLAEYQELKQLAQYLENWSTLQAKIYRQLRADAQQQILLVRIHLLEGEVDAALQMLQKPMKPSFGGGAQLLKLEIAQAAETTHPQAAIDIYRNEVYAQIAQRTRSHYKAAAEYVVRLRSLYQRINELTTWQQLVAEIRTNNPRLRALHDELHQAGL